MRERTCFGCTKLSNKNCGYCGLFTTASAAQWRKYPDGRCTQGKQVILPKKNPLVEPNIYLDTEGYYQVELNGEFYGRYNTLGEAMVVRAKARREEREERRQKNENKGQNKEF